MSIKGKKGPKKAYAILGGVAAAILIGYFTYGFLTGNQVTTDNAQLEADVVPLAAKVGGVVLKVHVADNQSIKLGDLIAEIDPKDYEIRVLQAEADLEAAKSQAETGSKAEAETHSAQVVAAEAALSKTEAEMRKSEADLNRARNLKKQKAISAVEFENAVNSAEKSKAAVEQAQAQLRLAEEQHGFAQAKVKAAEAALEQAKSQLAYTKIYAPRDGILSKIAAQEGQIIQPGQTVAQLVDHNMFVVANFKETQIGRMQPGQKVEIEVDAYPGKKWEGKVESLSAATGARFSLLPPDNASGNFVKVVQRVPVKISLDDATTNKLTLRAGLSAEATVYFK